ncbi:unnamed protein product [Adineta steineri]|uniref:Uncharacterized protein n=1 Tax=Adineta steineri TaxID=433720 RepID=A0A815HQI7_9BILA|nr:unnamed protein product [Adineta steineri]CAF3770801.1 unnamed protein product [Adineta steineri]
MSSYTDAANENLHHKTEKKLFDKDRPQSLDYLLNQDKWVLLTISVTLVLIYYSIFSICIPMMKDIHSKHNYFNENFKQENEKLKILEQKVYKLKQIAKDNLNIYNPVCQQCWSLICDLDFDYITLHLLENNKPIKKYYNDTLFPLQYIFMIICVVNTISIIWIFKKPFQLFVLSNIFLIISLSIHGEFFISNTPNIYYTLINGILLFLFSMFLLLKILMILLFIVHYRMIQNILNNE